MNSARILAFGALLLLATPAFAEGWRVESVSGDAVSVKGDADPEPLSQGDLVPEGATVVSDARTSVKLSRQSDVLSLSSDTIVVLHPGSGTTRASVEAKAGEVEIAAGASADSTFEVKTRFFRLAAAAADFTVKARKDYATVDVDSGQVQVDDPKHADGTFTLGGGHSYREEPGNPAKQAAEDAKAKAADADAQRKAAEAQADELAKQLDKSGLTKGKHDKKQSELAKKLLRKAPGAIKDGLDSLGDDYDSDEPEHEVPKIGIMRFLFGAGAPSLSIVLTGIGVAFLGLGYLSSAVLGDVGFGMFGNAAILLVGAAFGAGLHDLTFSPEYFWDYEPTPGILTPVIGGLAALIGACFARKYAQERMDEANAAEAANLRRKAASQLAARRASFGE